MQGYNIIIVFTPSRRRILMCRRRKNPYIGLLNLVGGKIEPGENGLDAAYRELNEETSIKKDDITLTHIMDFTYYIQDYSLEVYTGRLNIDIAVSGDENELCWVDVDSNFFDMTRFAGEGNIGHMIEQINKVQEKVLR